MTCQPLYETSSWVFDHLLPACFFSGTLSSLFGIVGISAACTGRARRAKVFMFAFPVLLLADQVLLSDSMKVEQIWKFVLNFVEFMYYFKVSLLLTKLANVQSLSTLCPLSYIFTQLSVALYFLSYCTKWPCSLSWTVIFAVGVDQPYFPSGVSKAVEGGRMYLFFNVILPVYSLDHHQLRIAPQTNN